MGSLLIPFYTHITECYFFSMAHLLTASVKQVPRLGTRCAPKHDPSITEIIEPSFVSRNFHPSRATDDCRPFQTGTAIWETLCQVNVLALLLKRTRMFCSIPSQCFDRGPPLSGSDGDGLDEKARKGLVKCQFILPPFCLFHIYREPASFP